ncbi:hypothetical protein LXL04_016517 [Taraxacum kok-saghyz]
MSLLDPSIEDLPESIMADILSRLPVKKIIQSKCVCKQFQNIVLDSSFAHLHFSRSPTGFMILHFGGFSSEILPGILTLVEVDDQLHHHRFLHDPVMNLDLNLSPNFQNFHCFQVGSVNGLICLAQFGLEIDDMYICNPSTREYIILPAQNSLDEDYENIVCCFGIGSLTHEYKVIRIFEIDEISEAKIYTLGTGQWRRLGHVPYSINESYAPFLNGHAHWITYYPQKICVFNFDNETFELFPSPPSIKESQIHLRRLGVLKGCLCVSDTYECKLVVWVMKEYGVKKSWYKELVIEYSVGSNFDLFFQQPKYPIEVFRDGEVLMTTFEAKLIVYCPTRNEIVDREIWDGYFKGLAYRPSFYRLHSFANERHFTFHLVIHIVFTYIGIIFISSTNYKCMGDHDILNDTRCVTREFNEENPGSLIGSQPFRVIRDPPRAAER